MLTGETAFFDNAENRWGSYSKYVHTYKKVLKNSVVFYSASF